jgi:hypothetical protein
VQQPIYRARKERVNPRRVNNRLEPVEILPDGTSRCPKTIYKQPRRCFFTKAVAATYVVETPPRRTSPK